MFKNIFPDELARLVYKKTKKAAPAHKESPSKKAKSKPKPKVEHKAEGRKAIEAARLAKKARPKKMADWVREYAHSPGSGHAEVFLENFGKKAKDVMNFFADVSERTGRKLRFGKNKVTLEYGANQYKIKLVKGEWNLEVSRANRPSRKVVYTIENWAAPWTLTKIKQLEEVLRLGKAVTIKRDLNVFDIAAQTETLIGHTNLELNPHFAHFGEHQEAFLSAMAPVRLYSGKPFIKPNGMPQRRLNPKSNYYYENPKENVGYFISEVSAKEAGVKTNDPMYHKGPENLDNKLVEASRKKAIAMFRKKTGTDLDLIREYMYSVHQVVKTENPRKVYMFWRMPLAGSEELDLKAREKVDEALKTVKFDKLKEVALAVADEKSYKHIQQRKEGEEDHLRKGIKHFLDQYPDRIDKAAKILGVEGEGARNA